VLADELVLLLRKTRSYLWLNARNRILHTLTSESGNMRGATQS
jgi:hypothetical protein